MRAMAWKRFRPPALQTVCESMFIGARISLLAASFIATIYLSLSYVSLETDTVIFGCTNGSVPVGLQWVRAISDQLAIVFYYFWPFFNLLLLFRPYHVAWTQLVVYRYKPLENLITRCRILTGY